MTFPRIQPSVASTDTLGVQGKVAVDQQLNRQAMTNIRRITLGSIPAALVIGLWLRPYVSDVLAIWATALVSVSAVGQFIFCSEFLRNESPKTLFVTRILVAMSGTGWGLYALFGIPAAATDGGRMRIVVMMCGVVTTSVASSNASPTTFVVYISPLIFSLVGGLIATGKDQYLLLGIVGFLSIVGESFRSGHATTRSAITLRQEADDLAARLAEALRLTEHDSLHDPLTGAGNRRLLARQSTGPATSLVSVLCIDLDHFKQLNDRFGHAAGDELLVLATNRIRTLLRSEDIVIRTGGDEFVVIVHSGQDLAEPIANRLIEKLAEPYQLSFGVVEVGASIGMATARSEEPIDHVQQRADTALYKAKSTGRGVLVVDRHVRTMS
jgi:diguanylate cyclase (GGDEF)-like protein